MPPWDGPDWLELEAAAEWTQTKLVRRSTATKTEHALFTEILPFMYLGARPGQKTAAKSASKNIVSVG